MADASPGLARDFYQIGKNEKTAIFLAAITYCYRRLRHVGSHEIQPNHWSGLVFSGIVAVSTEPSRYRRQVHLEMSAFANYQGYNRVH